MPATVHTYDCPVRFGARGYLTTAEGIAAALACVDVILLTRRGELEMEPEFGSRLAALAYEPNDAALAQEMRAEVGSAIARWEPRLAVERVTVAQDQHWTRVEVTLRVRGSDRRFTRPLSFSRR